LVLTFSRKWWIESDFTTPIFQCCQIVWILSQNHSPKSHPIPLITTRSPQASIFQKHFTSEKIIKRMLRWINCLWHVHLKWGMSVANIIKNAYLIVIMSLNDLSVVNKTKKDPLFPYWKLNAAQVIRNIEMKLAVSQTLICTTADDILLFWEKKVIMIRKLSISRSTYLLKRRVSFLLITTGYTSHVFFFTTECCDFGDRQPFLWCICFSLNRLCWDLVKACPRISSNILVKYV
jgi:hypothetical protein